VAEVVKDVKTFITSTGQTRRTDRCRNVNRFAVAIDGWQDDGDVSWVIWPNVLCHHHHCKRQIL